MKHGINMKHNVCGQPEDVASMDQWVLRIVWDSGVPWSNLIAVHGNVSSLSYIGKIYFGKIIARAFWKLRQFSKRVTFQRNMYVRFWYRTQVRTRDNTVFRRRLYNLNYYGSTFTSWQCNCLCANMYLIFNPWWMFSPCNLNMLMCANKTCFAGVRTRPKTIFQIRISFLSYPCKSK